MNSIFQMLSAGSNGVRQRAGLTLVEMLVATTASLILFGAVMAIFNVLGTAVNNSRSLSELEGQLCVLATQVVRDLTNATASRGVNGLAVMPPSGSAAGYFEIVEGPMGDLYDSALAPRYPSNDKDDVVGDVDDAIIFTCRSNGEPYRGRFDGITIEEPEAEVAYFCSTPVDNGDYLPKTYTLYRRQVLVSSIAIGNTPFNDARVGDDINGDPVYEPTTAEAFPNNGRYWDDFYGRFDLSVRYQPPIVPPLVPDDDEPFGPFIVLNTINDLQRRSRRLGHLLDVKKNVELPLLDQDMKSIGDDDNPNPNSNSLVKLGWQILTDNVAEDSIIARNVLAFDVRVLDPQARKVFSTTGLPLLPSDKDYWQYPKAARNSVEPLYVDLGYNRFKPIGSGDLAMSVFSDETTILNKGRRSTFDTWSEEDGSTPPPYDVDGLAGIQITIRLLDPRSKRIVQRTITHTF